VNLHNDELPGAGIPLDDHDPRLVQACDWNQRDDLREGGSALAPPIRVEAAFGQENQIVDSLPDSGNGPYLEDPWHRLTRCSSIECVLGQCRDIVRDDDAPLVGRPLQN
jgi:hypothetical protein